MVVIARNLSEKKTAANALKLLCRSRSDIGKSDRVEYRQLVGEVPCVVFVAEKSRNVAVDELVVDLTLEENVPDEFSEADARLTFRQVEVEQRQRFAPIVGTAGSARENRRLRLGDGWGRYRCRLRGRRRRRRLRSGPAGVEAPASKWRAPGRRRRCWQGLPRPRGLAARSAYQSDAP